ncbi:hypothetical protein T484DRAFT_1753742 [Baffinella frigidus]|nr:hypothetical protein T484DRAFT_1753742 [Cryptophyta sp. CCMP2293]
MRSLECSNNTSEHYEISVPVLLKPSNITYRSALGDERTSKMTPDIAKQYNELFHKVCVACAQVHRDIQKPVWADYLHPKHKKDSKETATVSTVPNASGTDESTVPKEDEKDEYKQKVEECKAKRLAAMLADAGCKNMIVAFFDTMTSTENLVANGRTQYTSLDNFTTHILSDADHVCGQTIGKHTVLASLVECEKSPVFMEWLRYVATAYVMNSEGYQAMKMNNVLCEDMDLITSNTTLSELALAMLSEEAQDCPAYRYNGIPTNEDVRGLIPNDDMTNTSQRDENQTPEQRVTRHTKAFADQRRDRMIMLPKTAQVEFKQIESNVMSGSQMTSFSCKEEKKVRPGHQNWYDIHVRADVFREEVKKARLAMDAADERMKTKSVANANADTQNE